MNGADLFLISNNLTLNYQPSALHSLRHVLYPSSLMNSSLNTLNPDAFEMPSALVNISAKIPADSYVSLDLNSSAYKLRVITGKYAKELLSFSDFKATPNTVRHIYTFLIVLGAIVFALLMVSVGLFLQIEMRNRKRRSKKLKKAQ